MLMNIANARIVNEMLQSKALRAEQLYLRSGKRMPSGMRLSSEGVLAIEGELDQNILLYLSAVDVFEDLACCYKVLAKCLSEEDPEEFESVIDHLAARFRYLAVHHFDMAYAYLSWHTADDYPVMHHLLVALTLARVALQSKQFTEQAIGSGIKAALSMNISMLTLQARLRTQTEPLSRDQKEQIRKHPEQSADKLNLLGVRDSLWIETVRTHHELPDGNGYPGQIKNENPLSVLLGVCDSFNARMAQRDYRKNFTAEQAVKDLFSQGGSLFSQFTAILLEELGIYPAGSLVQLSNNQIGCSLIRGETALSPAVLVFRNLGKPGVGAEIVNTAMPGFEVKNALPRRDLGDLPGLLELISRVI